MLKQNLIDNHYKIELFMDQSEMSAVPAGDTTVLIFMWKNLFFTSITPCENRGLMINNTFVSIFPVQHYHSTIRTFLVNVSLFPENCDASVILVNYHLTHCLRRNVICKTGLTNQRLLVQIP